MDVLAHMLDDTKYKVKGLPKGGCMQDQTFADDTTLYFKGTQSNMDKTRIVLDLFCLASGAKINWGNLLPFGPAKRTEIGNGDKR
jgi:hypothetical protein